MEALVTTGNGRINLRTVDAPRPKPGDVLVSVKTIALNHVDWKFLAAEAKTKDVICGYDFAGTVSQVGAGCHSRKIGDRVAGLAPNAAFSEYLVIPADLTIVLPVTVSFEDAAGLSTACISACQCLYQELHVPIPFEFESHKSSDEWILVWSGASSVGQYAIQLAKLSGFKVISTAAPGNNELVKSLGADVVLDHSDSWTARHISQRTGGSLLKAIDCWSQGMSGNQISTSFGPGGGTIATVLPYESRTHGVKASCVLADSIYGQDTHFPFVTSGSAAHRANGVTYCNLLTVLLAQNKLKFVPVKRFPRGLLGVAEGLEYMRLGKVHGEKIVYHLDDTPQSGIARYM